MQRRRVDDTDTGLRRVAGMGVTEPLAKRTCEYGLEEGLGAWLGVGLCDERMSSKSCFQPLKRR